MSWVKAGEVGTPGLRTTATSPPTRASGPMKSRANPARIGWPQKRRSTDVGESSRRASKGTANSPVSIASADVTSSIVSGWKARSITK